MALQLLRRKLADERDPLILHCRMLTMAEVTAIWGDAVEPEPETGVSSPMP